MKVRYTTLIIALCSLLLLTILTTPGTGGMKEQKEEPNAPEKFTESFSRNYKIEETASMEKSRNKDWWLSSGAYFFSRDGIGKTLTGDLSPSNKWFIEYKRNNSIDTDFGTRPQNIFRLVNRNVWHNSRQSVYARIVSYDLSESPNRNVSNGILLFNRYLDSDNLYYTGIRVDGYAVIKKKIRGEYITLAETPLADDLLPYDRETAPNQLPINKWIGVMGEVTTSGEKVSIKLYVDADGTGNWKLAAESVDDGMGGPILESGHGGIRTDFMDVEFRDYDIREI